MFYSYTRDSHGNTHEFAAAVIYFPDEPIPAVSASAGWLIIYDAEDFD